MPPYPQSQRLQSSSAHKQSRSSNNLLQGDSMASFSRVPVTQRIPDELDYSDKSSSIYLQKNAEFGLDSIYDLNENQPSMFGDQWRSNSVPHFRQSQSNNNPQQISQSELMPDTAVWRHDSPPQKPFHQEQQAVFIGAGAGHQ